MPLTVVTKGGEGAIIHHNGEIFEIPVAKARRVEDPTGAGDAFRAGFVRGYLAGLSMPVVGRIASMTACYAIEQHGTQEHSYTQAEFVARYTENYGASAELETLFKSEIEGQKSK